MMVKNAVNSRKIQVAGEEKEKIANHEFRRRHERDLEFERDQR
jgi:hypothetical protein